MACLLVLALGVGTASAQEQPAKAEKPVAADHTPTKGAVELSVGLIGAKTIQLAGATGSSVTSNSGDFSGGGMDPINILPLTPSIGFDVSWFVTDRWALQAGGQLHYSYQPKANMWLGTSVSVGAGVGGGNSGADEGSGDNTDLPMPSYGAVPEESNFLYSVFVGANHHWKFAKAPNLVLYTGFRAQVEYGLGQQRYDEFGSMGAAVGESVRLSALVPVGVKYYFARAFFVGAEVSPISYTYQMITTRPQEGLASHTACGHQFSFLTAPTIKIGFRF